MINVRTELDEPSARAEAVLRNRGRPVAIKAVFWVRTAPERDFVYWSTEC